MSGIPAGLGSPEVPGWAPDRSHVADYVPHRTLALSTFTNTEGEETYRLTFDQDTRPMGDQVNRLIADGVAWVSSRVAPMNVVTESGASVVATLYAASAVERSWPDDDQSLQRALDMEKRMDRLIADLIISNQAANDAENDPSYGLDVVPLWSFPSAPAWGDSCL